MVSRQVNRWELDGVSGAVVVVVTVATLVAMGEDHGLRPDGFDFPNSPAAVTRSDLSGRTLVQRTSAGTQGVVRATSATRLWAASLACASATARAVETAGLGDPTYVITGCFPDRPAASGSDDRLTADHIEQVRPRSNAVASTSSPACSTRRSKTTDTRWACRRSGRARR